MKTTPPEPVIITRTEAVEIMRHCGTPPATMSECEKCKAYGNCAGHFLRIAEILDDPLGTCWISVNEKLPEDGSDVLAYMNNEVESRIIPANYDHGVWFDCLFNCSVTDITHWMKIPSPPEKEDA